MDTLFSIESFLVLSSHETFVKENRWLLQGAIVESVEAGRKHCVTGQAKA